MNFLHDEEVVETFIIEVTNRVASLRKGLLALEKSGKNFDQELIHSMFRDAHSLKSSSNLLGLKNIERLMHNLEDIMQLLRERKILPTSLNVNIMCESLDKVLDLADDIEHSNSIDISLQIKKLARIVR
ncbi:Signal transduction histidine kinase, phosphotransfer (Hpt) region domain protein [Candidatus Magnetoovum chiemensis]|nr:Signal transduction histidine kinase, phosphotransfer (Hpt) region domain protein [Candidatus Magnetoovum chiemensis]